MDSEKFLGKMRFKNFSEPPLVLCYYRNERVAPFKFVVPRTQTCHARGRPLQLVGAAGGVVVSAEGGVVVSAEGGVLNRYISGWAGMGADTLFAKRGIDHDTCVRIYIYIYLSLYIYIYVYTCVRTYIYLYAHTCSYMNLSLCLYIHTNTGVPTQRFPFGARGVHLIFCNFRDGDNAHSRRGRAQIFFAPCSQR